MTRQGKCSLLQRPLADSACINMLKPCLTKKKPPKKPPQKTQLNLFPLTQHFPNFSQKVLFTSLGNLMLYETQLGNCWGFEHLILIRDTLCQRCPGESDQFPWQHLTGWQYLGTGTEFRLWSPALQFKNTIFSAPLSYLVLSNQACKRLATGPQCRSGHLEMWACIFPAIQDILFLVALQQEP